jgi:hypothetical protein
MEVIRYKRNYSPGPISDAHGFTGTLTEIFVPAQKGLKSFVFNDQGGIFYQAHSLTDGGGEMIEVADEDIALLRKYLDTRERLKDELFKE